MIVERLAQIPILWTIFEKIFGADKQKEHIYRSALKTDKSLLDFGCSSGNTTGAFLDFDYTGIDIDDKAIYFAKRRWFGHKNIKFICADILKNSVNGQTFDYILFAGTGHHISPDLFNKIVSKLVVMLKPSGQIWFYDILMPGPKSHILTRLLATIDRGKYIRSYSEYRKIFSRLNKISITESRIIKVTGTLIPQEDYCFFRIAKK